MFSTLASFVSVMTTILYVILAIVVLMVMITIHELGHYTIGKIFKFKINEFSIGFGKAIFSHKCKSGEVFSIRLIPLGGYCAFAGEDEDTKDVEGAFNTKPPWQRLLVQLGGVLFNFLSAIIFAFILLVSFGYDIYKVDNVGAQYQQQAEIGHYDIVQSTDVILAVDDKKVSFVEGNSFTALIDSHKVGDVFSLTVRRDGQEIVLDNVTKYYRMNENGEYIDKSGNVIPIEEADSVGVLGVTKISPYRYSFLEAVGNCVPLTGAMAWRILEFLGQLITGKVGLSDVGGPITTISTMAEYSQTNIANLFVFLPFIAVNLAVFNILPIPSLDGARMVFTTIEWIRRKPINRKVEAYIHFVGLILLLAFVVIIDIYHLII